MSIDKSLIERLAREAGLVTEAGADGILTASIPETDFPHEGPTLFEFPESLVRFASLVADECAKVAEAYGIEQMQRGCSDDHAMYSAAMDIEWAIRAKFRSTP
jgi:hypothetical protein